MPRRLCSSTDPLIRLCPLLLAVASLSAEWQLSPIRADEGPASLPRISVSSDGRRFIESRTERPFLVWGVNYDHDENGRLLEDYWLDEWEKVEKDFREIKQLGANLVRIHLQFSRFIPERDTVDEQAVHQLRRLIELAERERLYLDLTGLGCYHKKDVPAWYDALPEADRWQMHVKFWQVVAEAAAARSAVFCYDLMNEPVVSAGKRTDWLGPAFGDKHFVQFISLDPASRTRPEVARQWIETLVTAIRQKDTHTMITVGLVPWSLDRPGLTSGFVPGMTCRALDFISVHIYPEKGKLDEALDTLRGFDIGKPILVEEMFPLHCSAEEAEEFVRRSGNLAAGWVSFYWGKTAAEYRQDKTLAGAIMADWLERFQRQSTQLLPR